MWRSVDYYDSLMSINWYYLNCDRIDESMSKLAKVNQTSIVTPFAYYKSDGLFVNVVI